MKRALLLGLAGLGMTMQLAQAQDIHFSQYNMSPLTMNPALTGAFGGDIRAHLNYKDQWRSIAAPYQTYAFSFDGNMMKGKLPNSPIGAGISFFKDVAGDAEMGMTQVDLSVAGHQKLNEQNTLSLGFQGGYAQKSFNAAKLKWGNQYNETTGLHDEGLPSKEPGDMSSSVGYMDLGFGLNWNFHMGEMYSTANDQLVINAGGGYFHITSPTASFYPDRAPFDRDKINPKLVFHGASIIGVRNTNISVLPSAYYAKQGGAQEILAGGLLQYALKDASKYTGRIKSASIAFGGFTRIGDAFIASVVLEVSGFSVGVSYDVNTSDLRAASKAQGGVEIALRYINPLPFGGKGTRSNSNVRFL